VLLILLLFSVKSNAQKAMAILRNKIVTPLLHVIDSLRIF